MAIFTVKELAKATKAQIVQRGTCAYVNGVSTDTRTITDGELFIALVGENFDGHRFLSVACEKGATALIVSDESALENLPEHVTTFLVSNTQRALENIAHFHRMRFAVPVIGITGSNGKTTTKDMVAHLLSIKYRVCCTQKNFNNEIGLSQTLLSMTPETEVCVVEMGMRGLGQIQRLCEIAVPNIGVVTNVGMSHVGVIGSQENIFRAKSELIESLPADGKAVLNYDDPLVSRMGSSFAGQVIGYGVNGNYTVRAGDIQYEKTCTKYMCTCFDEAFKVKLHLLGIHNVYDSLAAVATARIFGVDVAHMQKELSTFMPIEQRQSIIHVGGVTVLDDSYNANPTSMEMALLSLKQMEGNRRFLVLGDMGELGEQEKALHYALGTKVADMEFDGLVAVGDLGKEIARGAKESGMKTVIVVPTNKDATEAIVGLAKDGDLVLLKASHFMHFEEIGRAWKGL